MRCDARQPKCGRCIFNDKECRYTVSRRGGLTRAQLAARQNPASTVSDLTNGSPASETRANSTNDTSVPIAASTSSLWLPEGHPPSSWLENGHFSRSGIRDDTPRDSSLDVTLPGEFRGIAEDANIDLYYRYFHKSHPFVLPRWHLEQQFNKATENNIPRSLILIIQFIGSLYARSSQSQHLRQEFEQALGGSHQNSSNPYIIQAHLLFAIALFWCGERKQAQEELNTAVRHALDLGMHRSKFAELYGNGDRVLEESWRRTWWQIYVVDAFFAAIARANTFETCNVDASVELPCEEEEYEAGVSYPSPGNYGNIS